MMLYFVSNFKIRLKERQMGFLINNGSWILNMKKTCSECQWLVKNDHMLYVDIKSVECDWMIDII